MRVVVPLLASFALRTTAFSPSIRSGSVRCVISSLLVVMRLFSLLLYSAKL